MTTKELIDLMKLNADGWSRTGDKSLIMMLEQAQKLLYEQEMYQTIAFKADGTLPNLATTDSTQTYNINATTLGIASGTELWRIGAILVKQTFSNELIAALRADYAIAPNLEFPFKSMILGGLEYQVFHQVNSFDAIDTSAPFVNFSINPNTTTTDYYVLAYKKAASLTSEAVQPDLPVRLHMTALLPAAMKLVEAHQNGSWIEALQLIEREYAPRVREYMSGGAQGETHTITRYED